MRRAASTMLTSGSWLTSSWLTASTIWPLLRFVSMARRIASRKPVTTISALPSVPSPAGSALACGLPAVSRIWRSSASLTDSAVAAISCRTASSGVMRPLSRATRWPVARSNGKEICTPAWWPTAFSAAARSEAGMSKEAVRAAAEAGAAMAMAGVRATPDSNRLTAERRRIYRSPRRAAKLPRRRLDASETGNRYRCGRLFCAIAAGRDAPRWLRPMHFRMHASMPIRRPRPL